MPPFCDRLIDAVVARKTPCIVNIDPDPARLPARILGAESRTQASTTDRVLQRVTAFCSRAVQLVAPIVPAVKLNIACYEPFGPAGIQVYDRLVRLASRQGLIVIGDVKRGDVGHTAAMYARAQLADDAVPGRMTPDAITVSGYLGRDGVEPFVEVARSSGKGVFILVRTSNPSAGAIQDLPTRDGPKVHEVLAALVAEWAAASETRGRCGYTSVGAVVATRNPADAARLRAALPESILLVPGYGAQGGSAADYKPYFKPDGTGAIVAAGRSILFAHESPKYRAAFGDDWERCLEQACRDFVADLSSVISAT